MTIRLLKSQNENEDLGMKTNIFMKPQNQICHLIKKVVTITELIILNLKLKRIWKLKRERKSTSSTPQMNISMTQTGDWKIAKEPGQWTHFWMTLYQTVINIRIIERKWASIILTALKKRNQPIGIWHLRLVEKIIDI